jgi:hypothetical protein
MRTLSELTFQLAIFMRWPGPRREHALELDRKLAPAHVALQVEHAPGGQRRAGDRACTRPGRRDRAGTRAGLAVGEAEAAMHLRAALVEQRLEVGDALEQLRRDVVDVARDVADDAGGAGGEQARRAVSASSSAPREKPGETGPYSRG